MHWFEIRESPIRASVSNKINNTINYCLVSYNRDDMVVLPVESFCRIRVVALIDSFFVFERKLILLLLRERTLGAYASTKYISKINGILTQNRSGNRKCIKVL